LYIIEDKMMMDDRCGADVGPWWNLLQATTYYIP